MKIGSCSNCSGPTSYVTKMPKLCKSCKEAPKTTKKKKRGGRFPKNKGGVGELGMFAILNDLLSGYSFINHGYYSFLISPKGQPLQLDRFYPNLSLAFEYDGAQHHGYIKYIHKSIKNYEYYIECDRLKERYCKENNVTLIRVSNKDKLSYDLILDLIKVADPKLYSQLRRI